MPETIASLTERLSTAERDIRDHAKTITVHNDEIAKQIAFRGALEITSAREDERDKTLYKRLDEMEGHIEAVRNESREGIKEIKGVWVKLQWIVISAVLGGIVVLIFGRFS